MPVTAAIVGGGAASLAGGLLSYFANMSAQDRAEALQNKALQEWLKISIPDPKELEIALEKFVQQGKFTPAFEQAVAQDPSAFKKIVTNPVYQKAQNRALSELEDIGNNGGLRLQDKVGLQEAQNTASADEKSKRLGIEASMARRGLGGSGFDVAAQLEGQQGIADRESQDALRVSANAEDRALQSIEQAGSLANQYRDQEFSENAQKASAEDRINQFNAQNLRDVNQRNTESANYAQERNLNEAQRIADQNVAQNNYEQQYNKNLKQQQFENESAVAAGKTGQYNQNAQQQVAAGQNTSNLYSNLASGLGNAAGTYVNYKLLSDYFNKDDPNKKKLPVP